VRLHEAPLAVDLLVKDWLGQLAGRVDSTPPEVFDRRPGISQTLRVCRSQLVGLTPPATVWWGYARNT
jgi:hypothetical protein